MPKISSGFKDFDKNKPVFNLEISPSEMKLIAKLVSHVRLGQNTEYGRAAYDLISAIEDFDSDIFEAVEDIVLNVVAEDGSTVVAMIVDDSAIFEFEEP